ncbi:MAG: peptidylprolyl isomerase [Bacteroidetes bacterium]|nr:peptidylprolyl isomerase [Bacteroidota bacterium]
MSLTISVMGLFCFSQKMTLTQMKIELEKSPNSPLYAKQVLKKRFKIDTIVVTRTSLFHSMADSLAYHGKIKKVYGPFEQNGEHFLVQILAKSPNLYYKVSQIFIDTSLFTRKFADSIGDMIIRKIKDGSTSFEQMARTYSMGGESATGGDIGWIARGVLMPEIEKQIAKRKKDEVFKIWTSNGLHILKRTAEPKQDTGFALMLRVFL